MKKKQRKRWLALLAAAMLLLPQGVCAGEIDAGENGGNSKAAEQPDEETQVVLDAMDQEDGELPADTEVSVTEEEMETV